MSRGRESPVNLNLSHMYLHSIKETAEILRISRRSVEELGKRFEVSKAEFVPGEPPPSCPRHGLRRTKVTTRKIFHSDVDVREFILNCRLASEGREPVHLEVDGSLRPGAESKGVQNSRKGRKPIPGLDENT